MNNRVNFVSNIQNLINSFNDSVVIEYGYIDSDGKFNSSDVDVDRNPHVSEHVLLKYKGQDDKFGVVQCIDMDGYYYILKDVLKAMERM